MRTPLLVLVILGACAGALITDFAQTFKLNSSLSCSDISTIPRAEQCAFVRSHCNIHEYQIGLLNYLDLYYCSSSRKLTAWGIAAALMICFVSLGVTASDYLCPNLYTISKFLELSDNLAGLTLLAMGNGCADVLSTYKALSVHSAGLAISELVGAALFILTVVVGSISMIRPFKVPRNHFMRDSLFYMLIALAIFGLLAYGKLNYVNLALLILLYLFYVLAAVYSHSWMKKVQSKQHLETTIQNNYLDVPRASHIDPDDVSVDLEELPTIEFFSSSSDDERAEFDYFISTHPECTAEERIPVNTGSYGVRVLLRELSRHLVMSPGPSLSNTSFNVSRASTEDEIVQDLESELVPDVPIILPEAQPLKAFQVWRALLPQWNPEFLFLAGLSFIVCAPVNFILRLTTPNRELAIEYGDYIVTRSNSFRFGPGLSEEDHCFSSFDFDIDVQIYKLQLIISELCLAAYLFKDISSSWAKLFFEGVILVLVVVMTYQFPLRKPQLESQLPAYKAWNYLGSVIGFILSLVWISTFASEIVAILKTLTVVVHMSDDILGATIFALGNSVGDFVLNIAIANMGMPVMAFGACFGGPLLTLSSLGANAIVIMASNGHKPVPVKLLPIIFLDIGVMFFCLIFLVTYVPRNNWMFDKRVGFFLLSAYTFSLVMSIFIEVHK